ncbi:MAG: hypothetical protein M0Q13_05385 [Methanothrix sp.]|jgi:hypothetical protein|nr:hypothetical protein [Methanothrix sp.]
MKWILFVSLICCLAWINAVSGVGEAANDTSTADAMKATANEATTYIFLQEGAGGSFIKNESGNYTLTITGVVPYTVFFSDRPARDAGFIGMDQFLNGFGFDLNSPPNALVMIEEGSEDSDAIVVELTSPQYNTTDGTLIYTAKILDDYIFQSEWARDLISKADKAIPESFGHVAIVIDNKAKLSCADSTVSCQKVDNSICGYIDTGCCWSWHHVHCQPCHDAETYDSECKAKYGSDCGYYGTSGCFD